MIVTYGERKIEQGKEAAFEALWRRMQEVAGSKPGFVAARLLKSENHDGVYATIEYWESEQHQKDAYTADDLRAVAAAMFADRMTRHAPVTEYCSVVGAVGDMPEH
ncbi:MAG: antibiotic biosynthesis monooxygenase family protein [Dehalococcoidia bacterium]